MSNDWKSQCLTDQWAVSNGLHPGHRHKHFRIHLKSPFLLYSTTFCESLSTKFSWTANSKAHLMLPLDENKAELRTDAAVLYIGKAALIAYDSALQLAWTRTKRSFIIKQKKGLSTPIHYNSNLIVFLHTFLFGASGHEVHVTAVYATIHPWVSRRQL